MQKWTVVAAFAVGLVALGCKKEESRWEQAAKSAETGTRNTSAELPKRAEGATLNAFFPPATVDGVARTFTAEKEGYVEAKLAQDGKDVGVLSISDARNDSAAKAKFANATERLSGFPYTTFGKNQSIVLVAEKYQVKVSSPTLDEASRKIWLERFNLKGLASL